MRKSGKPKGWFDLNSDSPQAQGLIGAWGRSSCSGAWWGDYSRNVNNDAILTSAPGTFPTPFTYNAGWAEGVDGAFRALRCSGSHKAYTVTPSTHNKSAFSISIWVRYTTIGSTTGTIQNFFDNNHASTQGFTLQDRPDISSGAMSFFSGNASVETTFSTGDNKWRHIVGTYDGTTNRIYVDGILNNSAAGSVAATVPIQLTFGAAYNNNTPFRFLTGSIEDPRLYNRVLSAAEIFAMWCPPTRWDLQWTSKRQYFLSVQAGPATGFNSRIFTSPTIGGGGVVA